MSYDSARGRTVLYGGTYWDTMGSHYCSDTWEWDGHDWKQVATSGPGPRMAATMAYDTTRGRTVLFGGALETSQGLVNFGDTWEWDGNTWKQVATTGPAPRFFAAMSYDSGRGRVVLFGGSGSGYLGDTWEWDGSTWTNKATSGLGLRRGPAMAYDSARGRTVLYGGYGACDYYNTYEWDGSSWKCVGSAGPPLSERAAMAYDSARGKTVMFGGFGNDGMSFTGLGDTWEWDGSLWAKVAGTGPSSCENEGMAYDSVNKRTVVFRGADGGNNACSETWEWDGNAWNRRTVVGPTARTGFSMAYDSVRARAVLFGGTQIPDGTRLSDTWEWDGSAWKQVATTGPPERSLATMAFDTARGRIVLHGGSGAGGDRGDTWEWDGIEWKQSASTGPPARHFSAMAYSSARGKTVLFGGVSGDYPNASFLADTWEWDGTVWQQVATTGPGPRFAAAMAHDSQRGKTILFGGTGNYFGDKPYGDTWEWDGSAWTNTEAMGPKAAAATLTAYDVEHRCIVLFEGGSGGGTWLYGSAGPPPYVLADVARCLGIAGGLVTCSAEDLARLDLESGNGALTLLDAVRIARKAAGLEANP